MKTELFTISSWVAFVATLALLLCSLLYCFRLWNPRYLRLFPLYVGLNLLVLPWPELHPTYQVKATMLATILEQGYFSGLLYVFFNSNTTRKALIIANATCAILISGLLWRFGPPGMDYFCGVLESLVLIPFCLLWFRQVFRYPVYERLVDQPSYWFVTGMLFYVGVQLPALIFTMHAVKHGQHEVADDLFSANNYSLVISYALFGIGMTWRGSRRYQRRKQDVQKREDKPTGR